MMLEIRITDSRNRRHLVLEGSLTGQWVAELRTKWKTANADPQARKLVVDLTRRVEKTSLADWRMFFCRASTADRSYLPAHEEMIKCDGMRS